MSNGGFLTFLRGRRGALLAAVLLLVGAFLLLSGGREDSASESASDEERLASFCSSIEGVGDCRAYITYAPVERGSSVGRVESVAVVCKGASSLSVRVELTELISSLYGIGTNRLSISKMTD